MATTEKQVSHAKPKAAPKAKPTKADQAKTVIAKMKQTNLALPSPAPAAELVALPVDAIEVRGQVRQAFDEAALKELAEDIAERGILQPLTVRRTDNGFVLVAGERRLRAARLANLATVPVIVHTMDEVAHDFAQLAENIQREQLTTAEEAKAVRRLSDLGKSGKEIAAMLHKSPSWVSKRLAASHPELTWSARSLLEDGTTEDLEIIICVDQLEKAFAWDDARDLIRKIRKETAGRTEARELVATMKEREAKRQEKALERRAKEDAEKAEWEAQRPEREAKAKADQEARAAAIHNDPLRLIWRFAEWADDNPIDPGCAYLLDLDDDQTQALDHYLNQNYLAGRHIEAAQLVANLTKRYYEEAELFHQEMRPMEWAATCYALTARFDDLPISDFLTWYKAEFIDATREQRL